MMDLSSINYYFSLSWLLLLLIFVVEEDAVPLRIDFDADEADILDLSHPFNNQTVYYPTMEQLGFTFQLGTVFRGMNKQGQYYSAFYFQAGEHGGTHVDAPSHNQINGSSVDQLPLSQLMGPAVVLDLSSRIRRNIDYEVSVSDLQQWEELYGPMPKNALVFFYFGWSLKWPHRNALFGTKSFPDDMDFHFPGLSLPAAKWLIKHRLIKAIGTDTPSLDSGPNQRALPVHQFLSQSSIPIIEFVNNLDRMAPCGAVVLGLPMKIQGASGAPLRLIAFNWDKDRQYAAHRQVNAPSDRERERGSRRKTTTVTSSSIFASEASTRPTRPRIPSVTMEGSSNGETTTVSIAGARVQVKASKKPKDNTACSLNSNAFTFILSFFVYLLVIT